MRKMLWIFVFCVAMALVEAAIVVYLRALYYPEGFAFPLKIMTLRHIIVELGREAATIFMLMAVAAISGRWFWEKFAYFILCFGIWDIFYYVWLNITLGWPSSLFDWDILYLIPLPWIGPVIAPASIAALMITIGLLMIGLYNRGYAFLPSRVTWVLTIGGTLILLYSFMRDTGAGLHQEMPLPYRYELLIAGEILYIVAFVFAWRNTLHKSRPKEEQ